MATPAGDTATLDLCEADVLALSDALEAGRVTAIELAHRCLTRIAAYDRQGIRLNAVPQLNPDALEEARAADERIRRGERIGPLDGVPYLVKASYAVKGLPVTSGSPAFRDVIAQEDAFAVERLRAAGAVVIGITNMPPMAAGGMQRGLYGRAESPHNAAFLTAPFASGSSNGSGTGLAAAFGAFALGEETWSSGRGPATNNGLVAYTPSRGLISIRGNWPLIPTMDTVVPYALTVRDMLELLDVLVVDDDRTRGDLWRTQTAVEIPTASSQRPADYRALADPDALRGKRVGVPRMYIGRDDAKTSPIETRASVLALWEQAARDLEALGAEVVEVAFPLVENYELDRPGAQSMFDRGLVPEAFRAAEGELIVQSWHDFLEANGDPALHSLGDADGDEIFPRPLTELRDRYEGLPPWTEFPAMVREHGVRPIDEIPGLAEGLRGLEETRRVDLEQWMDAEGLDCVAFPAVADVGPADCDVNPVSADLAWRNGTWVANGNQVIRHCGVPTVTVPMGLMADTGMPVGLTFAGRGYDDPALLAYGYAFEQARPRRVVPARTPALPGDRLRLRDAAVAGEPPRLELEADCSEVRADGTVRIGIRGSAPGAVDLEVAVNGEPVDLQRDGDGFTASVELPFDAHYVLHSPWRPAYGSMVTALARGADGACAAAFRSVGGL
ncbi:MAG: amidase [Actinomycetota bacterium]